MFDEPTKINILNNEVFLDIRYWCCDGGRKEPKVI